MSRLSSSIIVLACAGIACKGENATSHDEAPDLSPTPSKSVPMVEKAAGSIQSWCSVEARVVSAIETDRRAMCDSLWSAPDDCMTTTEPWFDVLDWEDDHGMTLCMPKEYNRGARLPMLSEYSEGSEEAVYPLDRKIWSTDPLHAWLLMEEGSESCSGPEDQPLCGLGWDALVHIVVRALDDGTFLVTKVRIDISEAYGAEGRAGVGLKDHPVARVDLETEQINVSACGGRIRLPVPGRPDTVPALP